MKNKLWTISELGDEFGISTRTIRFYEDKELLQPQRVGINRVYNYRDRARLQLILRGKRLGFSLNEIKEYIDLYNVKLDPMHNEQLSYLSGVVEKRICELTGQLSDLQQMIDELSVIQHECQAHITKKSS
ncbi:MAG: MerR family transcriptional regulator [Thiolinea sp.]